MASIQFNSTFLFVDFFPSRFSIFLYAAPTSRLYCKANNPRAASAARLALLHRLPKIKNQWIPVWKSCVFGRRCKVGNWPWVGRSNHCNLHFALISRNSISACNCFLIIPPRTCFSGERKQREFENFNLELVGLSPKNHKTNKVGPDFNVIPLCCETPLVSTIWPQIKLIHSFLKFAPNT